MITDPLDADNPSGPVATPGPGAHLIGAAHQDGTLHQAGRDVTVVHGDFYTAGRDQHIHTTTVQQPLPPSGLQVRYSLPGDVETFTGRGAELDAITTVIEQATSGGGVVTIHGGVVRAIDGMPGVGKTTLAVHAAHRVKDRFPDRCLFIDLHAHTPGQHPTTALDALGGLLTAVGVDPRYLPSDLDGRVGLWRDRMAGQRALLILDNAADSRQVTPLLPGAPQCLVLVTSRRYLGDLDAGTRILSLDVLPADQARALFVRLAPRAGAEPAAVSHVVGLAGGLPLAISLLARVYAKHPSWTLQDLIEQTRRRLLTVRAENTTIAAAFDLSYATLTPPQQRLFTLLGLHPGIETDDYAAAAVADIPFGQARDLLDDLFSARLLTDPPAAAPGRYGMHDLIRTYIRDRATTLPTADLDHALDRLLDYYQHTAAVAAAGMSRERVRHVHTFGPRFAVPELSTQALGIAWLRAERNNLIACLQHADRCGQHIRIVDFSASLAVLLRRDGPPGQAIAQLVHAISSYRKIGDRDGEAWALHGLGALHRVADDYPQAKDFLDQALAIFREIGNRYGQARALAELGAVRALTGDRLQAVDLHTQALTICREIDDRKNEAWAVGALGGLRRMAGDYVQAADLQVQALAFSRRSVSTTVRHGSSMSWVTFGR
jgi:tetratricopeptide (TPR) repeat protein